MPENSSNKKTSNSNSISSSSSDTNSSSSSSSTSINSSKHSIDLFTENDDTNSLTTSITLSDNVTTTTTSVNNTLTTTSSSSICTSSTGSNSNNNNTAVVTTSLASLTTTVQTEKPNHYNYLKGFRVDQCPLFLQHKCTQHRPYTCFYWHFRNQRRRRPMRKRDGTFNYNPDVYCDKYDEQTGVCSNSDDCPYVHRNAGDTEKRYHLRYYKTATCIHETDTKGHCTKNGAHCAFSHGLQDMRPPVYDIREIQQQQLLQHLTTSNNSVVTTAGTTSSSSSCSSQQSPAIDSSSEHQQQQPQDLMIQASTNANGELVVVSDKTISLSQSLEKERLLNEDPRWNDANFVLINYKTEQCKRPPRLCRQGFACPQYHNARDRRRNPSQFKYRSTPCPNVKQGEDWLEPNACDNGDQCKYCHSRTEQQFHPEIYKSSKCNDMMTSGYCPRGQFCAFAHIEQELKMQRPGSSGSAIDALLSSSVSGASDFTLESFLPASIVNTSNSNDESHSNNKLNSDHFLITASSSTSTITPGISYKEQLLRNNSNATTTTTNSNNNVNNNEDNNNDTPTTTTSNTDKDM